MKHNEMQLICNIVHNGLIHSLRLSYHGMNSYFHCLTVLLTDKCNAWQQVEQECFVQPRVQNKLGRCVKNR